MNLLFFDTKDIETNVSIDKKLEWMETYQKWNEKTFEKIQMIQNKKNSQLDSIKIIDIRFGNVEFLKDNMITSSIQLVNHAITFTNMYHFIKDDTSPNSTTSFKIDSYFLDSITILDLFLQLVSIDIASFCLTENKFFILPLNFNFITKEAQVNFILNLNFIFKFV
jgi:hypothetical protein